MGARRAVSSSGEIRTLCALPGEIRTRRSFSGDIWTLPGFSGDISPSEGPRAYESRPTTVAVSESRPAAQAERRERMNLARQRRPAPRACPEAARKRGWHARQVSKAARQCGAGAGVRFSPDATTTAPASAVSRCAAVVLLRACRESALIPRGYERAHTGHSHRHRARGR